MEKKEKLVGLMNRSLIKNILLIIFVVAFYACNQDTATKPPPTKTNTPKVVDYKVPVFNADSAYAYIKKQVDFGPRVPNTEAHVKCGNWLAGKFRSYGLKVEEQEAVLKAFDGTPLKSKNIIAKYKPERRRRIMFCAHWDTRPFADHDPDRSKYNEPIDGANDGGSGVGVILEAARLIAKEDVPLGIDFVLFDSEDYGQPSDSPLPQVQNSYCLGSQYWSRSVKSKPYNPMYGILLDMVGAEGAIFTKEGSSMQFAPHIVKKVWATANGLGYGAFFKNQNTKSIIDDHVYVSSIASIPTMDIIEYDPQTSTNFGDYWHTLDDNMDVIDTKTLNAVGQTILTVYYKEAYD